jgi:hypothetical protein
MQKLQEVTNYQKQGLLLKKHVSGGNFLWKKRYGCKKDVW